jgi:FG-GAP repeat
VHNTTQERYCNLGWSLAAGDINRDGRKDLIIGSPFAPSGGKQRGMVGVLYSSQNFKGVLNVVHSIYFSLLDIWLAPCRYAILAPWHYWHVAGAYYDITAWRLCFR